MIRIEMDQGALQQLEQRLSTLAPRMIAQVHQALRPMLYQSLSSALPKYFSGAKGRLHSRSGRLFNSVLESIAISLDGAGMTVSLGSDVPYAAIHEYGGYAGRRGPFKKKNGHRPYISARPYLRPTMKDLEEALPGLLDEAIQQVRLDSV
jgi:phage gpG-like protein